MSGRVLILAHNPDFLFVCMCIYVHVGGQIFGPKREAGEECIMRNFVTCMHHILLG
jgi:hypothetical protein